ncbi:MAG TPA: carboxylesterase, partial [Limnochordia bacterium]
HGLVLEAAACAGVPVMIQHGAQDPIIPVEYGRKAADRLRAAGAAVRYHEYAMAHQIHPDGVRAAAEWLRGIACADE